MKITINGKEIELPEAFVEAITSAYAEAFIRNHIDLDACVQISSQPKPTLDDVKAWAKANRAWVAWDRGGALYAFSNRPIWIESGGAWLSDDSGMPCIDLGPLDELWEGIDPGVPWDKSLIAPDGRMLSVDPPRPKRPKRTEWKVGDSVRLKGYGQDTRSTIISLTREKDFGACVQNWERCDEGWYHLNDFDPTFPRNARKPKPKARKLKRGMLCAMWSDSPYQIYPTWGIYYGRNDKGYLFCSAGVKNYPLWLHFDHAVPYRPEFEGATIGEIKAILAKEAAK